jgi:hypothetical protein
MLSSTVNMVHDLFYRYGFNEPAGNFQNHNFGLGGIERDGITLNVQDGGRFNNANFFTVRAGFCSRWAPPFIEPIAPGWWSGQDATLSMDNGFTL